MTTFDSERGVQWHEWKSLKRRFWSLWLKTERKTREKRKSFESPRIISAIQPFGICRWMNMWHASVHSTLPNPESGGRKGKRWDEIIFNGRSTNLSYIVSLWSCLFNFTHASSIPYIFNNDSGAEVCLEHERNLPIYTKSHFQRQENMKISSSLNEKMFSMHENNGKFLFCVFCSSSDKSNKNLLNSFECFQFPNFKA